tara:strand:+ start:396 stop:512 length:117 start_codon:yes stop_codon:yes gene_type:complete
VLSLKTPNLTALLKLPVAAVAIVIAGVAPPPPVAGNCV